ncbi:MAG: hypothetical protein ACRDHE_09770 [Ktedonobacterales bacterium]
MRFKKRTLLLAVSSVAIFSTLAAGALVVTNGGAKAAAVNASITQTHLKALGTTSFAVGGGSSAVAASLSANNEIRQDPGSDTKTIANNPTVPTTLPTVAPNPKPTDVTGANPGLTGFNGLNHLDQRSANNGNQFSLEPPDQGLCVGGDYTIEAINTALAVYQTHTHALVSGPTALNPFFGFAPEIIRGTPNVFGPFTSDPKCYYDASTGHWFITMLEIDTDPASGAFGNASHEMLAVSQTINPAGNYAIFSIDGSDPTGAGCPCFGDQPLIGADANGFYISTNEFSINGPNFNGAQIYAMSKQGLVEAAEHGGAGPTVVHIDASQALVPYGGESYSLQPATTPPGADYARNTEYFLSSLQFVDTFDNRIAVWALSNTGSLREGSPNVSLDFKVLKSETYGQPNPASQKSGPTYLGAALGEPIETLNTNDYRMNQVVYVNGAIYGAVNTILGSDGVRTGIAYFKVIPQWKHGRLNGRVQSQGYVSLKNDSVFFPSVAVNGHNQALMSFTISGPDYFPSSGYVTFNGDFKAGDVHVAAAGQGPEDGFTGYPEYGGNGTSRWGDYSAAGVNVDGSFWFADEYIAHPATDLTTRTSLANWATFVGYVSVGEHGDK